MKLEPDVAVIGASSAGFYAAELLASAGKRVCVFDRKKSPAHSRRTLIVTSELENLTGPLPASLRLGETAVMRLACGNEDVAVPLRRPDLVIDRSDFVSWMGNRAAAAGAEFFGGAALEHVRQQGGSLCLEFTGCTGVRQVSVREAVIGADGAAGSVAAGTGMARPSFVPILQAEVTIPDNWDPSVTRVWFDVDGTRFFYWLVPERAGKAVAGLIGEEADGLRARLSRFLVKHDLTPVAYQGGRVAMHHPRFRPWHKVGKTSLYLVGDAAGQVKATTVGGTVTGLLGARAAARSILAGLPYKDQLRPLKRELDLHWFIRSLLDRLDNKGYALLLSSLSNPVRTFLAQHNRDSMASAFWRLPLLQPRFFLVARRALLGKQAEPAVADTLLVPSENE